MKSPTKKTYRIAQGAPAAQCNESAVIPSVKIPVRCPQCEVERLYDYPEPVVVMALTRWNNMNLHVPCHDVYWCASQGELETIRQHLGQAWIESHASRAAKTSTTRRISA